MTGRTSIGEVVCCDGDVVQIEAMLRQQSAVLRDLEGRHPGISSLQKDATGRIVI